MEKCDIETLEKKYNIGSSSSSVSKESHFTANSSLLNDDQQLALHDIERSLMKDDDNVPVSVVPHIAIYEHRLHNHLSWDSNISGDHSVLTDQQSNLLSNFVRILLGRKRSRYTDNASYLSHRRKMIASLTQLQRDIILRNNQHEVNQLLNEMTQKVSATLLMKEDRKQ